MILSSCWLVLPETWDIANVRATLAFLINLFCTLGLWVFAYSAWNHGAREATKTSMTRLLSLLSISALGDVLDALPLLHFDMGFGLLSRILLQCLVVVVLSVTAIISGPIARYSTRLGTDIRPTTSQGWLATTNHSSMGNALVKWNSTIDRLKSAQFPLEQLLDFFPDKEVDWVYRDTEWNSSWTSSCAWIDRTPITLTATGNNTGDLFDEVDGLRSVFPPELFVSENSYASDWGGNFQDDFMQDILAFIVIQTSPDMAFDNTTNVTRNDLPLNISLAAVHMHHVPKNKTDAAHPQFRSGPIEASWYTRADCRLSRTLQRTPADLDPEAEWHIAFPRTPSFDAVVSGLERFHYADLVEQSFTPKDIYHPSGQDLFRFYQAYTVCKDSQYQQTASRQLSVVTPTVELAIPALAILLLYVFLVCLAFFWSVTIRRLPGGVSIPRTKVGWMMQGLREAGGREVDVAYLEKPWAELRSDLRSAYYGEAVGPMDRKYRTIRVEMRDQEYVLREPEGDQK